MKIEPTPKMNPEKLADALQMLYNPDIQPLFQRISSEYLYWDKVKYLGPKDIDKEVLWQAVKIQRGLNAQHIRFGKHTFHFTITDLPTERLQKGEKEWIPTPYCIRTWTGSW